MAIFQVIAYLVPLIPVALLAQLFDDIAWGVIDLLERVRALFAGVVEIHRSISAFKEALQ